MNPTTPEPVPTPSPRRARQLLLAGASVLSIGLAIPIAASAGQERVPPGSGSATTPSERPDRQARRAEYVAEVAAELGVPAQDLQSAMDTVQARHRDERLTRLQSRLDRRVAEGRISQEQADRILEAARNGKPPKRR